MKINKYTPCLTMEHSHNGRYVLAEEAEKLEQLNKEMLEILRATYYELDSFYRHVYGENNELGKDESVEKVLQTAKSIVAQAEAE